jgi:hypothetical protein
MVSREEAKAQGLTHYDTGKPCKKGHNSPRFVSSMTCCQCMLERQQTLEVKAYYATRYTANKTEIAARRAAYYKDNYEKIAARQAAYYKDNREKVSTQGAIRYKDNREKRAAYYKGNYEKIAARQAAYNKGNSIAIAARRAAYYKDNYEKIAARQAAYRVAKPHIIRAINAARRAAKLQATPSWADTAAIKAIYEQAAFMSKVLGEKQHVDHIYPLVSDEVCGLHVAANLQILTASDNIKKSNKLLPMYEIPV